MLSDYLWHPIDAILAFAIGAMATGTAAIWRTKVSRQTYEMRHQALEFRVTQLERLLEMINVKLDKLNEQLEKRLDHLTERMDRLQG